MARKLSQKPIDIESLIQEIIDREKNIIACLRKKKENALNNYKSMIQGDTITIPFPVRISEDNLRSTIYYDCPTYHWDFKKDTDLEIKGKVVKKFYRESPQEYFIEIQVLNLSDLNTMFFFNRININDTIRVNLNLYGNRI
ncbi:MAG: hypothetical protein IPM36_21500 [Lewinellaceae bacterium]|nr:hypothetical protein [Lewinellaceae bacterium]